jgi:4-hydroxy-2-oxoheptanedioate aldolase
MPAEERDFEVGGWAMLGQSETVEALGRAGFDFVGLDLQHGALDVRDVQRALALLDALGVPGYVRLTFAERALIPRVLDFGAAGVIVAMVESAEQAAEAAALARYQPHGNRSYGGQRHGLAREPADVLAVRPEIHVMIETRTALESVHEIAATEAVDGLAVGPVDLALALRDPEGPALTHSEARTPAWEEALSQVVACARATGLPTTSFAVDGDDVRTWVERGFDRIVLASDVALLRRALGDHLRRARGTASTSREPYA